jgi:hypothetical protein
MGQNNSTEVVRPISSSKFYLTLRKFYNKRSNKIDKKDKPCIDIDDFDLPFTNKQAFASKTNRKNYFKHHYYIEFSDVEFYEGTKNPVILSSHKMQNKSW